MLTRSEFCTVADCSSDRLQSLVRRHQLPFLLSPGEDEMANGHRRYRSIWPVRLQIMDDLAREGGLTLDAAADAVVRVSDSLEHRFDWLQATAPHAELWAGVLLWQKCDTHGVTAVAGRLNEVADKMMIAARRVDATEENTRLVLVNASAAFRRVLVRAQAAGISLPAITDRYHWLSS